jgi:hypothetical protein
MTGSVRRRPSFSRALLALGAVALLALVAVAALLLGGAFGDQRDSVRPEVHQTVAAVGGRDHAVAAVHPFRQQPLTRARGVAFAVLASAVVAAAWAFQRLRSVRAGRVRTLRIVGLPPGRGPPALRIA